MKSFFYFCILFLFTNNLLAQLEIDKKFIDFGIIHANNIRNKMEFTITNSSITDTIKIESIKLDSGVGFGLECPDSPQLSGNNYPDGCFEDFYNPKIYTLKPKETLSIKVIVRDYNEPFFKSFIYIDYIQKNKSLRYVLPVVASSEQKLVFEYSTIDFGVVQQGQTLKGKFYFKNISKDTLNVNIYEDKFVNSITKPRQKIYPNMRDSISFEVITPVLADLVKGNIKVSTGYGGGGLKYLLNYQFIVQEAKYFPMIRFDAERFNLETVKDGNGDFEYWVENIGTAPLLISSCKASCGCVVPECPSTAIKPNQKIKISGKYDTKKLGVINKNIVIESNDRFRPRIELYLDGMVKEAK